MTGVVDQERRDLRPRAAGQRRGTVAMAPLDTRGG